MGDRATCVQCNGPLYDTDSGYICDPCRFGEDPHTSYSYPDPEDER